MLGFLLKSKKKMLKATCDRAYLNYVFGQEIMSNVSETIG